VHVGQSGVAWEPDFAQHLHNQESATAHFPIHNGLFSSPSLRPMTDDGLDPDPDHDSHYPRVSHQKHAPRDGSLPHHSLRHQ
jgi:hypothetical protein